MGLTRFTTSRLKAALLDTSGNVAIIFGAALIPMVGLIGAAVDYSRARDYETQMHKAADAAALAAAKDRKASYDKKLTIARTVFENSLGSHPELQGSWFKLTLLENGVRVEAGAEMENRIVKIIGFNSSPVRTVAEAISIAHPTEVALVLDNTGSMKNDMAALRKAAKDFTETLFASAADDQLKMAVVPYVAAVNVGRASFSSAWLDTAADSRWHAMHLEERGIGDMTNCDSDPFPKPPPTQTTSSTSTTNTSNNTTTSTPSAPKPPKPVDKEPRGKDRSTSLAPLQTLAALAVELFGIKAARADVTPRTDSPTIGDNVNPGLPYRSDTNPVIVPSGFKSENPPCGFLRNPKKISHFDLFNRIEGARWKGCVEARPEPYDVTDDVPTSMKPDTLFVPYFWPDEPGGADSSKYANSYMDDGPLPPGWEMRNDDHRFANLFKYNLNNKAKINENGPITFGPNASCPDEILPLTNNRSSVLSKVQSLRHWEGGGTINSEGVMWGWRVLSPNAPFTEGLPYDEKNKKYIVLMSDGLNSFVANQTGGPTKSDYTAYGYLRNGRLPSDWFSTGEEYLNGRMQLACNNVKATGIKVMTILFRETDPTTAQLMKDCATDPQFAFQAANESDLRSAFDQIAGEISKLRLSK